nr:hypothetical protein [uncultured Holophaga sp.]
MNTHVEPRRPDRYGECGGVTILVVLMLLVLMTLVSVGMAKNSFREIVITGTSRQGEDVRNVADTGLGWSINWLAEDYTGTRPAPSSGSAAEALRTLQSTLYQDATLRGVPTALSYSGGETTVSHDATLDRDFNLTLTYMGQIALLGTSSNVQQNFGATSASKLQLMSIRSEGHVTYAGGTDFIHRREAWVTYLPK